MFIAMDGFRVLFEWWFLVYVSVFFYPPYFDFALYMPILHQVVFRGLILKCEFGFGGKGFGAVMLIFRLH